ncbi:FecR family protein [Paraflavitalea sp. CAU 1676]|uniref:FecR family protein n=1 Tax=Paraflavitalea sp. CAU 1676 TaxID=3032598 RepID=UPI0023D9C0E7|nr:FecR family protein [Paraflavitalea sp. CAU 1676]MDF2189605.1 FecR domain-containing protein [Paraflavitalea sp. CAU 1676]
MEKVDKIVALILKYRGKTLTEEESNELELWLSEADENRSLFNELVNDESLAVRLKIFDEVNSEAIWAKSMDQVASTGAVVPLRSGNNSWWKYAAAAAVILGVSIVGWQYLKPGKADSVTSKQGASKDNFGIVPGSSKASLTLIDGSTVALDKSTGQDKIQQEKVLVTRSNGQIVYTGGSEHPAVGSKVLFNTLTTQKGGNYRVILPDGSVVHLNAASSLRFPIAFAGNERNVSLTGEAFFEVAPMPRKPFKVKIETPAGDGGTVEVLGTRFNINAYSDVSLVRTTLLHGSVKLVTPSAVQKVLKPNQEAIVNKRGQIVEVREVDGEKAVAWQKDKIELSGNIEEVLQDIARWYDLTVEFKGKIPNLSLTGQIERTLSIDEVEGVLRKQGLVFELRKKERIIVLI